MERSADWLDESIGDLEHARSDLERGFFNWSCFSAQQAAEKAAKAVLQKWGLESWGHSVADLLTEVGHATPLPNALIEAALELDKAYIPTRYPDALPSGSPRRRYTRTEGARMVGYAEQIVIFCEGLLSSPQP